MGTSNALFRIELTPAQRAIERQRLLRAWGGFWAICALFVVLVVASIENSAVYGVLAIALVAAKIYLLVVVASVASKAGRSAITWAGGCIVMPLLGDLVLPGILAQQMK